MNKTLTALLLAAALPLGAEGLPLDPKGQVTLSWDKFNSLWDTLTSLEQKVKDLEKPATTPPVPFALSGAAYKGAVRPGRGTLEAVFALEIFDDKGWVKVPFLPASVAVTEARMDGKPFGLIRENGMHTAVVRGAGRHTLAVTLSFSAPKEDDAPELTLPVPETPMTAVSLFFPRSGLDVEVSGAQGQETRPEQGGTRVTAALSPTGVLRFRWHRALPVEQALPRKIYVDGETLFTVSEGALRGQWTLRYTVLHQAAQQLALRLPEGWNVLNVAADGLEDWKTTESEEGPQLSVRFTHPRKGMLVLTVEAERGLNEKEDLVPLPRLAPLDVERQTGIIAIQAKGAVEVTVPEAAGVQGLDPQELPPALWAQAQSPLLFAFRHTGRPELSLAVTRHPDVPVLATTVDMANALTLMTKRGETVTRVQYHVRNRVKQHLAVTLPASAALWSAFVGGEPVKPTRLPDGGYRLPLRRANGTEGDQVLVEIVYFMKQSAVGLAGRRALDLPLPDAPVSQAFWSLYLPSDAHPLRFAGDMDPQNAVIRPMDEPWTRRMSAAVGGMARKSFALLGKEDDENMNAPAPMMELQSRLLADSLDRREDKGSVSGVFPVYFQIPTEGSLYHFGRSMIVGESPRLTFAYAGTPLVRLGWMLFWTALAGLAWRLRRRLTAALQGINALYLRRLPTA